MACVLRLGIAMRAPARPVPLSLINAARPEEFGALLGPLFEHSPWVVERAATARPFASVDALHASLMERVGTATRDEQLALLRAHPELAGQEAVEGRLTEGSAGEQARLGFTALGTEEFARVGAINRRYRERFGFPCIVALVLHAERASVLAEMERCLGRDPEAEFARALEQIGHISRCRLETLVTGEA
jgi:chitin deacetylase